MCTLILDAVDQIYTAAETQVKHCRTDTSETNGFGLQLPSPLAWNNSLDPDGRVLSWPLTELGVRFMFIQCYQHIALAILANPGCCGTRGARIAMERNVRHAANLHLQIHDMYHTCSLLRAAVLRH